MALLRMITNEVKRVLFIQKTNEFRYVKYELGGRG